MQAGIPSYDITVLEMKLKVQGSPTLNNVKFHYNDGTSYYFPVRTLLKCRVDTTCREAGGAPFYRLIISRLAGLNPSALTRKTIFPVVFFVCTMARQRPLNAL
jgi:hypothetical protein